MNYIKKVQKNCAINKNIKKRIRGSYKKISPEIKCEILSTLMQFRGTLSQISEQYDVNKETIRSFYKKLNQNNLYYELELYLVRKYVRLNVLNNEKISKDQIQKSIKNDIDHYEQDQELEQILKQIQTKREQSKSKRKKPVIQFTSKNRRIINKIVNLIIQAGEAAAQNNTDFQNEILTQTRQECQDPSFYQYENYDPAFSNSLNMSFQTEQESQLFYQSQQTETRPYFTDI